MIKESSLWSQEYEYYHLSEHGDCGSVDDDNNDLGDPFETQGSQLQGDGNDDDAFMPPQGSDKEETVCLWKAMYKYTNQNSIKIQGVRTSFLWEV